MKRKKLINLFELNVGYWRNQLSIELSNIYIDWKQISFIQKQIERYYNKLKQIK